MLASFILSFALTIAADFPDAVSSFSDGPLRITGKQLVTSILKPDEEASSVSHWKCQADGATMLRFGDITASADGMSVTQIDADRYRFELKGNAGLRFRGLSAKATEISWAMDDSPMVLVGQASLTVVIDGKPTALAADKILFDHKKNSFELSDGTVKQLPSSKVHSLVP